MKQKLFTIMMAAVIFLTLVAPVHTAADIALPVDEPIDRYETVTDIGGDSPLTSIADGCSILNYASDQSGDQIVLNQSYDFYYDIAKDEYFCRVMTTTSDEDGCCSAYFTLYSL